jgi:outer membrane protein assembly factor BamB
VFLIEQDASLALVARKVEDGTIGWSKTLTGTPSIQAPVLARGLLLIAEQDGVDAYDPLTGNLVWNAPGLDARQTAFVETINTYFDACGGADTLSTLADTSLAAATGSTTLVVTAADGVHILSLDDGSTVWSGPIPGTTGPLKNPVIVGKTLYAVDTGAAGGVGKLVALTSP